MTPPTASAASVHATETRARRVTQVCDATKSPAALQTLHANSFLSEWSLSPIGELKLRKRPAFSVSNADARRVAQRTEELDADAACHSLCHIGSGCRCIARRARQRYGLAACQAGSSDRFSNPRPTQTLTIRMPFEQALLARMNETLDIP